MGLTNERNLLSGVDLPSSEAQKVSKPKRDRNDYDKWLVGASYRRFKSGIKSDATLEFYRRNLYYFCTHVKMTTEELVAKYSAYLKKDGEHRPNIEGQLELQELIENYVLSLRERVDNHEIEATTCATRVPAVKLFCDMNPMAILNWTRINKLTPHGDMAADDEAYSLEDIRKMLNHCDLRARTLILILASSAMRLEAISELKDGDITPIYDPKDNRLLAAHVKVYSYSADGSYDTFISPEAYLSYFEYRNARIFCGDKIAKDSPAIIARFSKKTFKRGPPKKIHRRTTQAILLVIRKKAKVDAVSTRYKSKHYTIKTVHGMRKFWNTAVKSVKNKDGQMVLSQESKELLIGHRLVGSLKLERNYDRSEMIQKLLVDFLKVLPALTIADEARLKLKVNGLQEEVKNFKSLDIELAQKDKAIRQLEERLEQQQEQNDRRYEHVIDLLRKNPKLLHVKSAVLDSLKEAPLET